LRADAAKFEEQNAQVLGISVDSRFSLGQFSSSLGGLPYPLLADFHPKGEVSRSFGAYNEDRGISFRVIVIIDKHGMIRWTETYQGTLPQSKELLEVLEGISE